MRVFWQQIVKDVRLLKWPLAAWLLLAAAAHATVLFVGSQAWPTADLPARGKEIESILVPLATCVFVVAVALLVQHDSPARPDGFWLTRPVSRPALFGAKLTIGVVVMGVVPLALDAFDHWWFGVRPAFLSTPSPATVFAWLFMLMAVAAATTTFAQFVLIAIFEVVLFGGLVSIADSFKLIGRPDVRPFLAIVAAIGFIVSALAYAARRQRLTATLLGCAPVVLAALTIIIWPSPNSSPRAATFSEAPCPAGVTVTIDERALRLVDRFGKLDLEAPVKIDGLPRSGTAGTVVGLRATFDTSNQHLVMTPVRPHYTDDAIEEKRVRAELAPSIGEGIAVHNLAAAPFTRPRVVAAQLAASDLKQGGDASGRLRLEAVIPIYRYKRQGVVRPSTGAEYRGADSGARIAEVSAVAGQIVVRMRESRSDSFTARIPWYASVYALTSRSWNEAVLTVAERYSSFGFYLTGVLTMLLPVPQNLTVRWETLRFDIPPGGEALGRDTRNWLASSEIVVVGLESVGDCRLLHEVRDVNLAQLLRRSVQPPQERR